MRCCELDYELVNRLLLSYPFEESKCNRIKNTHSRFVSIFIKGIINNSILLQCWYTISSHFNTDHTLCGMLCSVDFYCEKCYLTNTDLFETSLSSFEFHALWEHMQAHRRVEKRSMLLKIFFLYFIGNGCMLLTLK